ncbi:MAG TPA: TRAP transporter large permease [Symbiobacteriaceae bacterium]|jgi:C4-dicarboxylate transporter DctM subunit
MTLILAVAFIILLLLGEPIAFVMGGSTLIYLLVKARLSYTLLPQTMFSGMDSFPLMAVPFFMLAGALMNEGGITQRLIHFARLLVGHIKGGLGFVNVLASMLFAGISGSAVAEASAIGSIMIPAMKERGYDEEFSAALTASASTLGPIIPPSIPMVLYGVAANVSIGALFVAGALPGLLLGLAMMVLVAIYARKRNYPRDERASGKELLVGLRDAVLALLMPGIILGGILGGIFTATESAAVAVIYAIVVGGFIYRELKWKRIPGILLEAGISTAAVMLIIGMASSFGWVVAAEQIPQKVATAIFTFTQTPWVVLLLINMFLLFVGTWLETAAALTILVPVLAPIGARIGLDPVHFGTIVVLNLVIGLMTPPVGSSLFVVCSVAKMSLERLSKAIWPFIIVAVVVLALVTYVPAITLWLPRMFIH